MRDRISNSDIRAAVDAVRDRHAWLSRTWEQIDGADAEPRPNVTDKAIEAVRARGREELAGGPIAVAVSYDAARDRVVVEPDTGVSLGIPRLVLEGLRDASPEQLQRVEILGPGTVVAWDEPDVGFAIDGLVQGQFGSERWMAELGPAGGAKRSAITTAAARLNGTKGGRPRSKSIKKKAQTTRKKQPKRSYTCRRGIR